VGGVPALIRWRRRKRFWWRTHVPILEFAANRGQGIEIRRNQHALRAVSRRTPPPLLLPLLRSCSFRLVNDAFTPRFRWDLAPSLRYFLRPLIPFLRNRSVSPSPTPNPK